MTNREIFTAALEYLERGKEAFTDIGYHRDKLALLEAMEGRGDLFEALVTASILAGDEVALGNHGAKKIQDAAIEAARGM